jgi:tetratricopeptide (TPR) repeat protein
MAVAEASAFGKYELLERIAYGGMAELHLARLAGDQGFEKLVAVKRILPHYTAQSEVVEGFIEEAKLAAHLQHENIVQIYDFGRAGRDYFIAMEYLPGKDLRSVLAKLGTLDLRLPLAQSLYIAARVCAGLDYAHDLTDYGGRRLGIVHRDISPQNVFITYGGQVKILDFGIAKAAGRRTATQAGVLKGKVAYMSPEQVTGQDVDRRSDVFAVGLLLYELVAGRRAFEGEQMAVMRRLAAADFPVLAEVAPEVPTPVERLIQRALARDPDRRYATCGELLEDLETCGGAPSHSAAVQGLAAYLQWLFSEERSAEQQTLSRLIGARPTAAVVDPGAGQGTKTDHPVETASAAPGWLRRLPWRPLLAAALTVAIAAALLWYYPRPASSSLEAGRRAFDARRYAEAAALFEDALARRPDLESQVAKPYAAALRHQAAQELEADPRRARDLLVQSLELDADSREGHFNLGMAHLRLAALPQARGAFERVVALQPRLPDAWFNLGYVQAQLGATEEAIASYTRAVELAPPYLDEVLYNLAMLQEQQGDLETCVRQLDLAVQYNPHNIRAISYRERILGRMGKPNGSD